MTEMPSTTAKPRAERKNITIVIPNGLVTLAGYCKTMPELDDRYIRESVVEAATTAAIQAFDAALQSLQVKRDALNQPAPPPTHATPEPEIEF